MKKFAVVSLITLEMIVGGKLFAESFEIEDTVCKDYQSSRFEIEKARATWAAQESVQTKTSTAHTAFCNSLGWAYPIPGTHQTFCTDKITEAADTDGGDSQICVTCIDHLFGACLRVGNISIGG